MNSAGIKYLRTWKRTFKRGHSGVLESLQARGERTRVSHAATVKVHTKKYLWAERWGGRLRYLGSRPMILSAMVRWSVWMKETKVDFERRSERDYMKLQKGNRVTAIKTRTQPELGP